MEKAVDYPQTLESLELIKNEIVDKNDLSLLGV
jgi:hypothetical protein